jgi:hypothetical protein
VYQLVSFKWSQDPVLAVLLGSCRYRGLVVTIKRELKDRRAHFSLKFHFILIIRVQFVVKGKHID